MTEKPVARTARMVIVIAALAGIAVTAGAQNSGALVSGVVVDAVSGLPLQGVLVSTRDLPGAAPAAASCEA